MRERKRKIPNLTEIAVLQFLKSNGEADDRSVITGARVASGMARWRARNNLVSKGFVSVRLECSIDTEGRKEQFYSITQKGSDLLEAWQSVQQEIDEALAKIEKFYKGSA